MYKFSDLEFKPHGLGNEEQARMDFPNEFGISVISGPQFHTSKEEPYECAVMYRGSLDCDTYITDNVIGYCTEARVEEIMNQIAELPERINESLLRRQFYNLTQSHCDLAWIDVLGKELPKEFFDAPAACNYHSNYKHGLLKHTVGVMRHCEVCLKNDDVSLDAGVLMLAAGLHDLGKIYCYQLGEGTEILYTEHNTLFRHIFDSARMAYEWFAPVIANQKRLNNLIHCILAHHGKLEWGSPVVPVTNEAIVLHNADMVESRTSARKMVSE
jgi:23S rRNA maturation-related 3'-5' exoribonuclease YhaM